MSVSIGAAVFVGSFLLIAYNPRNPGGSGDLDSHGDWLVTSSNYFNTSHAGLVPACLCVIKSSGPVNHDTHTLWLC